MRVVRSSSVGGILSYKLDDGAKTWGMLKKYYSHLSGSRFTKKKSNSCDM